MAKRQYTKKQLVEAIEYWEHQLRSMNESETSDKTDISEDDYEEEEDAVDDEGSGAELPKEKSAMRKAAESPIGEWNLADRLRRIHIGAVKHTKEVVSSILNKSSAKFEPDAVEVLNSYFPKGKWEPQNGQPMIVGIRVRLDKSQVKGFRKFMAVLMKESDPEFTGDELDEGLWNSIVAGVKAAKQASSEKAAESIKKANEELKKRIGVAGLKEYFLRFCGKNTSAQVKVVEPAQEGDENNVMLGYYAAVEVEA